jgi:hypothetical protein
MATSVAFGPEGNVYVTGLTVKESSTGGGGSGGSDDDDKDNQGDDDDDNGWGCAMSANQASASLFAIMLLVGIFAMVLGCRRKS